jgi:hypothetical protein
MIEPNLLPAATRNKISLEKPTRKKKIKQGHKSGRFALDPAQMTDYLRPTLAE